MIWWYSIKNITQYPTQLETCNSEIHKPNKILVVGKLFGLFFIFFGKPNVQFVEKYQIYRAIYYVIL